MNNFFLRPWARGPLFGGEEEGGGGGGDDGESNREASLGGAAATPVDPFARSARTKARISTGRQDNMNNRFAGVNNTVFDNDNDSPSTGSVPPGTGSGIDYTGTIPSAGEGGSSRILDGVITGNDDPDFFVSPPFQELDTGNQVVQPNGDVGGPDNLDLDLRPGILTGLGNMLVGPAGGATDNLLNPPITSDAQRIALQKARNEAGGRGLLDIAKLGYDFFQNKVTPRIPGGLGNLLDTSRTTRQLDAIGQGKREYNADGTPKQYSDAFGTLYDTTSDAGVADAITEDQQFRALRDQAAGRSRDYGEKMFTPTDYSAIDPQTGQTYFLNRPDYNSRLSNNRGGDYVFEEGRGMTLADKEEAMKAPFSVLGTPLTRANYYDNAAIQNDPVYGPGGAYDFDVTGGMERGPSKTITLPSGQTYEQVGDLQPVNYGSVGSNVDQGLTRLLGSTAGGISEILNRTSGNQLSGGAAYRASEDLKDLANRKFEANLTPEQKERLMNPIFGEDGGGFAALGSKAVNASPSLAGALLASAATKSPTAAMGYGALTFGGESRDAKNAALDALLAEGTLEADPTFAKFYDQTGNKQIALEMTKKAVNDKSMQQDLLVGATSGLITDRIFKGAKILPTGAAGRVTTALGNAPVVGPAVRGIANTANRLSTGIGRGVSNANQKALSALGNIPVNATTRLGQVIPKSVGSNLTQGFGRVVPASRGIGVGLKGALQGMGAEGFQEGFVEPVSSDIALNTNLGGGVSYNLAKGPEMMDQAAVGAALGMFGGANANTANAIQAYRDSLARAQPVGSGPNTNINSIINNRVATPTNVVSNAFPQAAADASGNIDPFAINSSSRGNDALVNQILNQRAAAAAAAAARDNSTGGAPQRAAFPDLSPTGQANPLVNEILAGRNQPVAPGMDTRNAFDPAGGLGPAAFGRPSFADVGPTGGANPLVSEILAARNQPTAPNIETRLDPVGGLGPAGGAATGFVDNAPTGGSNPLVSEILAGRNIPTAPNIETRLDPVGGLGPSGGAATGFVDNAPVGNTNPLVGDILAGRNVPSAPEQDAIFTPEGTTITPAPVNVLPSNEQGTNYTPPAAAQRGPNVDPILLQKQSEIQALIDQGLLTEEQAARMMAINDPATNTLENIMNDMVLESNTGNNLIPVSNNQVVSAQNILPMENPNNQTAVAPYVFEGEVINDPTILRQPFKGFGTNNQILEDAVLADEVLTPFGPEQGVNKSIIKKGVPDAETIIRMGGPVTSGTTINTTGTGPVTTGGNITSSPITNNLETTNTNPYIDTTVQPPFDGSDDDDVTTPVGSGEGDSDDVTTPPDEDGNCPPGYIMKFINGMYICVPIEEDVAEEEEEEEVVTYGRPRAGSYYQPRTVGRISPYILNSDEV